MRTIFSGLVILLFSWGPVTWSQPAVSPTIVADERTPPRVLCNPPKNMEVSDWVWGPGGKNQAPKPPFRFQSEDLGGTNPKVKVRDARNKMWSVKFGPEVHADTFTPRLIYALGYIVERSYFVAAGKVMGVHDLQRAKNFFSKDGSFVNARFKLLDDQMRYADEYKWSWVDNPFIGTHELNGLKILMMLTSNWDAKDARDDGGNTAVFQSRKLGPLLYGVDDWGASMGKWGGFFRRDKWDCAGYQSDTPNFVKGVKAGFIEWGFSGKHADDITHGIRVEDVIWLNTHLSRVTDKHLRAGLKASGATPLEIDCFTKAIRARIKQLREVASRHRETGERGHLSLSTKASTRSVQKNHFAPELIEREIHP